MAGEQRFTGRTVLITGGARGIGYAAAQRIAAEGGRLALADIDGATAAAKALPDAIGIACDITREDDVHKMVEQAERTLGPLSVFINSAAVLDDKLFLESGPADWQRMLGVCLHGPMLGLRAVLPGMVERGHGRVVCLASDSARIGQARLSYYAAAKAGVIALVKSVAQEVGRRGVTLNVVSPGATNTPLRLNREQSLREQMGEEKYARRVKSVLKLYPVGRIGEPEDIAASIAFLCSDEASWITGQVLSVNGGFVMP
ncbi:SDR family NAD(P)-dependent oxidoreductase [Xanthobacter sp. VNH20]|jgi:NAD(P)-dependent dehydrogenase (short-subunit alcohol dehydrogenase family)|uniref:SDR family NAD(P)-dependent oxidoreductase n=1 Tax=Xanthobacter sp. VNH20 TaxID=3156616 RepID=UPI0032B3E6E3